VRSPAETCLLSFALREKAGIGVSKYIPAMVLSADKLHVESVVQLAAAEEVFVFVGGAVRSHLLSLGRS
jgi:hypothetical protein